MKHYRNDKKELFAFDLDCFDESGKCINPIAEKIINENNLVEISDEQANEIMNYKSPEQIAEEERLSKLPTKDELEKTKIELIVMDLLTEGGLI